MFGDHERSTLRRKVKNKNFWAIQIRFISLKFKVIKALHLLLKQVKKKKEKSEKKTLDEKSGILEMVKLSKFKSM